MKYEAWVRAAEYSGMSPDDRQIGLMARYAKWLVTEGRDAGGVGPGESERIDRRHLADSLLFASKLSPIPDVVWDLGSGVGLPGIPLAICMPGTEFKLVDRSGRRCDLMRRALRVLDLGNCEVWHSDVSDLKGTCQAIVSRATLSPVELTGVVRRHLGPGGVAVAGGSWQHRPEIPGWTTEEIPASVLDQTIWLLIMRRQ
jgi:16S rRNA (guanine527-N7)-methyltransferase